MAAPETHDLTTEKIAGAFEAPIPHLFEVYAESMRETDQVTDAPTIEILDAIVRIHQKYATWGKEIPDRLCAPARSTNANASAWSK